MKKEIVIKEHEFTIRTWNYGEKTQAVKKSTTLNVDKTSGQKILEVDPWMLNDLMIVTCTVKWDLIDSHSKPIPITVENVQAIEPPELIEELLTQIQQLNKVSPETEKK